MKSKRKHRKSKNILYLINNFREQKIKKVLYHDNY